MSKGDKVPVYWAISASLVEEMREEGVLPPWELSPLEMGEHIWNWLQVTEPCDLSDRVLHALGGEEITMH